MRLRYAHLSRWHYPQIFKLINVERSDTGMLSWAGAMGFESYALQYEMALTIPAGRQE